MSHPPLFILLARIERVGARLTEAFTDLHEWFVEAGRVSQLPLFPAVLELIDVLITWPVATLFYEAEKPDLHEFPERLSYRVGVVRWHLHLAYGAVEEFLDADRWRLEAASVHQDRIVIASFWVFAESSERQDEKPDIFLGTA